MTETELRDFNKRNVENGKSELISNPGIRFLCYGGTVDKEGWWDWDHFEVQLQDVVELFNFLYPQYQLLVEIV